MRSGEMADASDLKSDFGIPKYGFKSRLRNNIALVAQWLEQVAHNDLVGGSNPSEGIK